MPLSPPHDDTRVPKAFGAGSATPAPDEGDTGPTLRDAAARAGKLMGTAVDHLVLPHQWAYREVLAREFDYVTPENAMKWASLHPHPDEFRFADGDALVAFAEQHNMKVKGHTLVWHNQLGAWVGQLDAASLRDALEHHIRTVVGHYKGKLLAWDVVNEAVADDGCPRKTVFLDKLGPGYIADAFRWAHEADPEALLFYNDYDSEGLTPKSDAVYRLAEGLKAAGVPISGVGLQMHIKAGGGATVADVARNMDRLAKLGLLVNISEMDVRIRGLPGTLAQRLDVQRQIYADIVAACMGEPRCHAITLWGFTDAHSWVDGFFGADDPLPFDEQYRRKPAYSGIRDAPLNGKPVPR